MGGAKRAVIRTPLPAKTRAWTPRERAIIDLHQHYLTQVWSASDWKVYREYKKHLAPEHRHEVDRLLDLIEFGQPIAFRELHETILATIWDKADWLAVLEDPKLVMSDFDSEELRLGWLLRIARMREL
jgi:hypothetical protein